MPTQNENHISEWEGLKGRLGAWYLNSPLRRLAEILVLGDLHTVFLQKVAALLQGNETVLDVGAGSGYFSLCLAARLRDGKVICIDLSPVMLEVLKRKAKSKNLLSRIETGWGNIYHLNIPDSSVDVAISNGLFHELSQPEKALLELKRALKPGGAAIITDFRDTFLGKRIGAAHRPEAHGPFSPEELGALFKKASFSNTETIALRHWVLAMGNKSNQ